MFIKIIKVFILHVLELRPDQMQIINQFCYRNKNIKPLVCSLQTFWLPDKMKLSGGIKFSLIANGDSSLLSTYKLIFWSN